MNEEHEEVSKRALSPNVRFQTGIRGAEQLDDRKFIGTACAHLSINRCAHRDIDPRVRFLVENPLERHMGGSINPDVPPTRQ